MYDHPLHSVEYEIVITTSSCFHYTSVVDLAAVIMQVKNIPCHHIVFRRCRFVHRLLNYLNENRNDQQ